jgi:hypothetical protein
MAHRRRAVTAMAGVAVAVFLLADCGGGGGDNGGKDSTTPSASVNASSPSGQSTPDTAEATPSQTSAQVLAQIKGEKDVEVTINSAVRDSGGFVTVQGVITNNGTGIFNANKWVGNETALTPSGASVAGAVLVDEAGKKRYYVLRDTEGRCLCTMKLLGIQPHESRPFFAQFPSPPPATTEVQFELPTMPPAKITLSQG